MDFFARQDAARRKTGLLTVYFLLAVVLIVVSIYAVVVALFASSASGPEAAARPQLWNPQIFGGVAAATLLIIAGGSLAKIAALSGGGDRVASMLGGRLVPPNTTDLSEKRLLNIVEEMAVASGVPVPPVYLLEKEAGINAFAAGFRPENAVVAVTRGTIERLNRDELQGVVGHEFSHILNGDMRLNVRLMGTLHGILLISLVGYWMMRSSSVRTSGRSRDDDKGRLVLVVLGLALMIIGWIGVFFGRLIKSAVAREREYLADASSVQFTRNPLGIANALKKIGGLSQGSRITHPRAEEASHMYFGNGIGAGISRLFATHPPLAERIRRLDPDFDGAFPEVAARDARAQARPAPGPVAGMAAIHGAAAAPADAARHARPRAESVAPAAILDAVGSPSEADLTAARGVLAAIPEPVLEAAREPFGARALVYALLLDREPDVRARQLEELQRGADPAVFGETKRIAPAVGQLPRSHRLAVVDLAAAGLRALSPDQAEIFRRNLKALVEADRRVDLFEYALRTIVVRHLNAHAPGRAPATGRSARTPAADCACILSAMAYWGADNPQGSANAFRAGAGQFASFGMHLEMTSQEACGLAEVDAALNRLAEAPPRLKRQIVVAAFACLSHDRAVTENEAELFRAIAAALDVPVSPWAVAASTD